MSFTWVCWLDANAFIVANFTMQNGKTLTKSEDFFRLKQAVCYYEPENKSRTLYFFECDEVVFLKEGVPLKQEPKISQEGELEPNIGVMIFNGKSKVV
jgi:hypothetical protein